MKCNRCEGPTIKFKKLGTWFQETRLIRVIALSELLGLWKAPEITLKQVLVVSIGLSEADPDADPAPRPEQTLLKWKVLALWTESISWLESFATINDDTALLCQLKLQRLRGEVEESPKSGSRVRALTVYVWRSEAGPHIIPMLDSWPDGFQFPRARSVIDFPERSTGWRQPLISIWNAEPLEAPTVAFDRYITTLESN